MHSDVFTMILLVSWTWRPVLQHQHHECCCREAS